MNLRNPSIAPATAEDLEQVSAIIASAVNTWPAPARLKRAVLPVLAYDELDLADHEILLLSDTGRPIALAAWQTDTRMPDPHRRYSTLLHGLFVAEEAQKRGIGLCLQAAVARRAHVAGFHGLHVKAERFAADYFIRCGYRLLTAAEQPRGKASTYPYWFWQDCSSLQQALRLRQDAVTIEPRQSSIST